MKSITGFLIIASVTLLKSSSAEIPAEIKSAMIDAGKQCAKEMDISEEIIEKIKKHEPISDPAAKCFKVCVMDKFGLLSDDKINKDKMLEGGRAMGIVNDDNIEESKKVLNDCSSQYTGTDRCEAANTFCECISKAKRDGLVNMP